MKINTRFLYLEIWNRHECGDNRVLSLATPFFGLYAHRYDEPFHVPAPWSLIRRAFVDQFITEGCGRGVTKFTSHWFFGIYWPWVHSE